ncbi:hypothetical protein CAUPRSCDRAFT_11589 [Caulochytrium protostelioides]|uniref:Uncharacterized protein n=1 Tax=Caulochytrium protostelioides TaxID=1555241 RepID=A0A4P9WTW7_9FUNG|nr:hypothetical protein CAUPRSCDRAFT_11589 [Caulochytrium protostelioides]
MIDAMLATETPTPTNATITAAGAAAQKPRCCAAEPPSRPVNAVNRGIVPPALPGTAATALGDLPPPQARPSASQDLPTSAKPAASRPAAPDAAHPNPLTIAAFPETLRAQRHTCEDCSTPGVWLAASELAALVRHVQGWQAQRVRVSRDWAAGFELYVGGGATAAEYADLVKHVRSAYSDLAMRVVQATRLLNGENAAAICQHAHGHAHDDDNDHVHSNHHGDAAQAGAHDTDQDQPTSVRPTVEAANEPPSAVPSAVAATTMNHTEVLRLVGATRAVRDACLAIQTQEKAKLDAMAHFQIHAVSSRCALRG